MNRKTRQELRKLDEQILLYTKKVELSTLKKQLEDTKNAKPIGFDTEE